MGIFDKLKDMMDGDNKAQGEATVDASQPTVDPADEWKTDMTYGDSQPSDTTEQPSDNADVSLTYSDEQKAQAAAVDDVRNRYEEAERQAQEAQDQAAAQAAHDQEVAAQAAQQQAQADAAAQQAAAQAAAQQAQQAAPQQYTVVEGDTLWDISQANGTTVDAIVAANGIENPDLIFPGQVLTIPK